MSFTALVVNNGQYVDVRNSGNVSVCYINLMDVTAPTPGRAESAMVLGSSEVAIQLTDGRAVVYDLNGKFLRAD